MTTLENRNHHQQRRARSRWLLAGVSGLLAVACAACASPDPGAVAASLAEARRACNLNGPAASDLTPVSLTVPLPGREQDYATAVSSLSCLGRKLGGPSDFGDRVMYGTRPTGNATWGGLTVSWNLNTRPNGDGVLSIVQGD